MTKHRKSRPDEIIEVILDYTAEYGFAPSIREIAQRVNLASTSGVYHHLMALVNAGRIAYQHGIARSIRVLQDDSLSVTCPTCHRLWVA